MKTVEALRIKKLTEREEKRYFVEHPKSRALFERSKRSLISGTPSTWQATINSLPFPPFIEEAKGCYLTDVDGHRYLDVQLCDHCAGFGHSPEVWADAVAYQAHRGATYMLPNEDSIWVGEDLSRRFGLPYWNVFLSASDANRAAIKIARVVTERNLVLMHNGEYHGTIDETMVHLKNGKLYPNSFGNFFPALGPLPNPELRTRVIEFNDIDALEKALSHQDIACDIGEPAVAEFALEHPIPGWHDALREMTRRFGTLEIIDETHTIVAGPGGLTRILNLKPDILVIGKGIGGGEAVGVLGISQEVNDKLAPMLKKFILGIGTTCSGNALGIAALKATLQHLMTEEAYEHKIALAEQLEKKLQTIIKSAGLSWCTERLGCRVDYHWMGRHTRGWAEKEEEVLKGADFYYLMVLYLINRGILQFLQQIMLANDVTTEDIDFYAKVFGEFVNELVG